MRAKVLVPAGSWACSGGPSPQSIMSSNVSPTPGSVTSAFRTATPFSTTVIGLARSVGATLRTVTVAVVVLEPPSRSSIAS